MVGTIAEPGPTYSRWRAGTTTFGPLGRILATLFVLMLGPWGAITAGTIVILPAWTAVAVIVLRQTWKRERVTVELDEGPSRRDRFERRHPTLGRRLNPLAAATLAGLLLLAIGIPLLMTRDEVGLYFFASVGVMVGVGSVLAWLSGM
jgi:hypothetical protein